MNLGLALGSPDHKAAALIIGWHLAHPLAQADGGVEALPRPRRVRQDKHARAPSGMLLDQIGDLAACLGEGRPRFDGRRVDLGRVGLGNAEAGRSLAS